MVPLLSMFHPVSLPSPWPNFCGGIFVYGSCPSYSASSHQAAYNIRRTPHSYDLHRKTRFKNSESALPSCCYSWGRNISSSLCFPHWLPYVWQSSSGKRVVDRLAKGAQNELANIVTILLGLGISATLTADRFAAFNPCHPCHGTRCLYP